MSYGAIGLLLLSLPPLAACGDTVTPKPSKPRPANADRITPNAEKRLKGSFTAGRRYESFKVVNMEPFDWTILNDIEISVTLRAGSIPPGAVMLSEHYVTLRCPRPRTVPAGESIEIPFDACAGTTQKRKPGALVSAIRIVAQQGYFETNIEPALEFGRPPK